MKEYFVRSGLGEPEERKPEWIDLYSIEGMEQMALFKSDPQQHEKPANVGSILVDFELRPEQDAKKTLSLALSLARNPGSDLDPNPNPTLTLTLTLTLTPTLTLAPSRTPRSWRRRTPSERRQPRRPPPPQRRRRAAAAAAARPPCKWGPRSTTSAPCPR